VKRRWWLVVSTALIGLAAGWIIEQRRVDTFTAEVLLQVQNEDPLTGMRPGLFDLGSHLDILRDRSVLGPVVDSLGIQVQVTDRQSVRTRLFSDVSTDHSVPRRRYSIEKVDTEAVLLADDGSVLHRGPLTDMIEGPGFRLRIAEPVLLDEPVEFRVVDYDDAVDRLYRRLEIEQGTGIDVIRIRFSHPDPEGAAAVVNTVARSYQDHRARSARQSASRTRLAIADQLVELTDSLRAVENLVLDYQQGAQLMDPEIEGNALLASFMQAETELQVLRFDEGLLESLAIGVQNDGGAESFQQLLALGQGLVPAGPALIGRLQELQSQREGLTASQFGRTSADPQVQTLDSLIATQKTQIRFAVEQSLRLLRQRKSDAEARYFQLQAEVGQMPRRTAQYSRLQQRVDAVQAAFDRLVDKYYEAQIAEDVETGDIELIAPSPVPIRPDPSFGGLNVTLSLLVGMLVGMLATLALDQMDPSIRGVADAERAADLQVLATIPNVRLKGADPQTLLIGKEAFRTLRTHLLFAPVEQPRAITVTSPTPRDGKSTVAANLALTLVEQGGSVILIDADMRRPQLHTTFGLADSQKGLSDVLTGGATLDEVVQAAPGQAGLVLLPAGTPVDNPTELIGSETFSRLVTDLRERFDMLVIDTPPLLAVTDAALIGVQADGTLVVVRANKTDLQALEAGVATLRRLRVPLLGVVMNDMHSSSTSYSYYPSYDYAEDSGDRQKRPILRVRGGSKTGTHDSA
jgi:capsular exopolysaccharide synthesis family protein